MKLVLRKQSEDWIRQGYVVEDINVPTNSAQNSVHSLNVT
jgi:hypothetical protein